MDITLSHIWKLSAYQIAYHFVIKSKVQKHFL